QWSPDVRSQRQRHGNGLAVRSRKVLELLLGEASKQTFQFTGESNQCVPSAVDREIVAARVQQIYFAPELGQGTHYFHFPGKKLLVQHGKLHIFFYTLQAAQANGEAID